MTNRVLTEADLEEFTPAEIEALRGGATASDDEPEPAQAGQTQAQEGEGADAAAEQEAKEPTATPADDKPAGDDTQPAKTDTSADTAPDADTLADVLAEAQPSDAPRYELPDTASIADQRKALREQRAALDAKWIAGAITDAERSEKVDAIDDQLDDLLMQATRANTLADVNRQNAINDQVRVIDSIRRDGAKVGIDYKPDGDAAGQFDTALQVLAARKDMAGKPFEDLAREAHRVVLALNGKLAAAPATSPSAAAPAAPAPAPAPKPAREIPPTLGHMPAAARAPIANDFMSEFAGIDDPDRAEAMLENMPARQREALLRSTVKVQ